MLLPHVLRTAGWSGGSRPFAGTLASMHATSSGLRYRSGSALGRTLDGAGRSNEGMGNEAQPLRVLADGTGLRQGPVDGGARERFAARNGVALPAFQPAAFREPEQARVDIVRGDEIFFP